VCLLHPAPTNQQQQLYLIKVAVIRKWRGTKESKKQHFPLMVQQHTDIILYMCALHYYVSASARDKEVDVCTVSSPRAPPFIFRNGAALPKLPLVRRQKQKGILSTFTARVNKAPFNLATKALVRPLLDKGSKFR
jgi:hypothetical protein